MSKINKIALYIAVSVSNGSRSAPILRDGGQWRCTAKGAL